MLTAPIAPTTTAPVQRKALTGRVSPALAAAMAAQVSSWERDLAAAEASLSLPPLALFFDQCQGVVLPEPVMVVGENVLEPLTDFVDRCWGQVQGPSQLEVVDLVGDGQLEPLSALVARSWGHADGEEEYDPADGDAVRRQEGEDEEWPEDNQDRDFHGESPEDEQRDSYGPDEEQDAIGDMHSSQYE